MRRARVGRTSKILSCTVVTRLIAVADRDELWNWATSSLRRFTLRSLGNNPAGAHLR